MRKVAEFWSGFWPGFWAGTRGTTAIEYAVIAAGMAVALMAGFAFFGDTLAALFDRITDFLDG